MSGAAGPINIGANVARIRERIAEAAVRAGRRPEEIRLVAASKQVEAARIREAISAGISDVGENYVQEAAAKRSQVTEQARWHLIGHLQRNKAPQAARIFDIIQTVDSPRIAGALGRLAAAEGRELAVLLQVNTSGEATKSGVAPEALEPLAEGVMAIPGLQVEGLMTIGSLHPDAEQGRPEFRLLVGLARKLESRLGRKMKWLSMGMSHDFEVAIEEGANLVRIGTGIFGPRPG
jgi:pyridoxal phosphate enzyme (YggS family)